jgi:hypothetical protein
MKGALLVPFAQDNCLYYIHQNKFVSRDLHPLLQGLQIFDTRSVRGKGLRVLEDVACGSVVGDYGGVYRHGEVTSTNAYTFGVGDHGWVVDAEFHGNLLRYVNDPHGTGHAANVRAETVCYYARGISLMTVRFITTMDVAAAIITRTWNPRRVACRKTIISMLHSISRRIVPRDVARLIALIVWDHRYDLRWG